MTTISRKRHYTRKKHEIQRKNRTIEWNGQEKGMVCENDFIYHS